MSQLPAPTMASQLKLSVAEQRAAMAGIAPGGRWFPGWRPRCTQELTPCRHPYHNPRPYGFECPGCGDQLGFDGRRLRESPLTDLTS